LFVFSRRSFPEGLTSISALKDEVNKRALTKKISDAIKTGQEVKYNRSKIMFIGAGAAGKTSTIRSLLGKPFLEDIDSTIVGKGDIQVEITTLNMSRWKEILIAKEGHPLEGDFERILGRIGTQKCEKERIGPETNLKFEKLRGLELMQRRQERVPNRLKKGKGNIERKKRSLFLRWYRCMLMLKNKNDVKSKLSKREFYSIYLISQDRPCSTAYIIFF